MNRNIYREKPYSFRVKYMGPKRGLMRLRDKYAETILC